VINGGMKNAIYGITIPAPHMTRTAAVVVAAVLSIPTYVILTMLEALMF